MLLSTSEFFQFVIIKTCDITMKITTKDEKTVIITTR